MKEKEKDPRNLGEGACRASTRRRRALHLEPNNVDTLCNFGWMLHDVKRDYDAAERLYKQARARGLSVLGLLLEAVSGMRAIC